MNERTLELAKQAGLKVESWMTNPPKPFQILGSTEQFEKFAELIVQECASVIEKNHPEFTCKEDADNLYRKAGRMDAIDEILQHFGVE